MTRELKTIIQTAINKTPSNSKWKFKNNQLCCDYFDSKFTLNIKEFENEEEKAVIDIFDEQIPGVIDCVFVGDTIICDAHTINEGIYLAVVKTIEHFNYYY